MPIFFEFYFDCFFAVYTVLLSNSILVPSSTFRLLTETVRQSQGGWNGSSDWTQVEVSFHFHSAYMDHHMDFFFFRFSKGSCHYLFQGAWVLKPKTLKPTAVVHFIGGIFVGAAPQLTYRFFLERLTEK